jgi:hypothetical protein
LSAIKKKKAHIRRKERQEQKEREKIVPSLSIKMNAADLSQVNSKQLDRIYNHSLSTEVGVY